MDKIFMLDCVWTTSLIILTVETIWGLKLISVIRERCHSQLASLVLWDGAVADNNRSKNLNLDMSLNYIGSIKNGAAQNDICSNSSARRLQ